MEIDDCFFGKIFNIMNRARLKISWEKVSVLENNSPFGNNSTELVSQPEPSNLLMILYRLPIITKYENEKWHFSWDDDALYLTLVGLRKGLKEKINFLWIGILNYENEIPLSEQEKIACTLLEKFNCIPVFLSSETRKKFYQGFCKSVLWPTFHSFYDLLNEYGKTSTFDRNLWLVYCLVNRKFADITISAYHDGDLIWIHDYHLMVLPSHLRKNLPGAKIGYFFHIPWPSSEIYRQLPIRDELLRGLLSSSLLGFHLFYYVRHFLSSCVRILNLHHESEKGALKIHYGGRYITIRVSHIGIDPKRFGERLMHPKVSEKVFKLKKEFKGKKVIGAIDDLDVIKGISLKLLAFENLLKNYPNYQQNLLFIQVALPDTVFFRECVRSEIRVIVKRINDKFGTKEHSPVMYIERKITFEERVAIYSVSDIFFLTPIRDGLNLIPYEYIVSANEGKGQLILSEFTGCSNSLSGAVRINPWNIEEVSRALDKVLQNDPERIKLKHATDFKFVSEHTTKEWAESFLMDLKKTPESTNRMTKLGLGFGLTFQIVQKEISSRINFEEFSQFYGKVKKRLFLVDYEENFGLNGFRSNQNQKIQEKFLGSINFHMEILSRDPKNIIFVISGRTRDILHFNFNPVKFLGVSAENGFFYRFQRKKNWNKINDSIDLSWIPIAFEIMRSYTIRTDGSFVEEKATGLVWYFGDSDPEFGYWQAKEMFDHLEGVLGIFEVRINWGNNCIQVEKKISNKKKIIKKIFNFFKEELSPNLAIYIGNKEIDEKTFGIIKQSSPENLKPPNDSKWEHRKFFFRDPKEAMNFFGSASLGSFRNSVDNWSILNSENYKNKQTRLKLPNLS